MWQNIIFGITYINPETSGRKYIVLAKKKKEIFILAKTNYSSKI